jgi:alpha-galactosidase
MVRDLNSSSALSFAMAPRHFASILRSIGTLAVFAVVFLGCSPSADAADSPADQNAAGFHRWAATPPMGWNSWDCFGTTLTEAQAKSQADAMAQQLKPYGWTFFTVDIQWYEGASQGHDYKAGAPLTMDEFSRLLPAPRKFPSATNEAGFKPLAEYVHALGLKFGIHIMRGIPRQAVRQNTPIKGTTSRAADIALTNHTCAWNPDMYGVDMTKPGAQAYYDSLVELYASWGVDFVKVDDIARAYDEVQKAEIEAIRKAIDNSGRPMVLSLSPGDTPLARGSHVNQHANMWRISDDFWDRWQPLYEMFERLDKWTPFRLPGAWPDADMLPFGVVEFTRPTRFTQNEQILCMTLWCIARSPLILGGDMTKLDAFTLSLLTNSAVLAVNQSSTGNRQLSRKDNLIVWTAQVPNSRDQYVALFNAQGNDLPFDLSKALYKSPILRGPAGTNISHISVDLGQAKKLVLVVTDAGDGFSYDHADWIEPTLQGPQGTLKLTDLKWTTAKAGWRNVQLNRTIENRPITLNGAQVDGIGTHSISFIEYDLPDGYSKFNARGALSPGSQGKGSVEFLVLTDSAKIEVPNQRRISVSLAELGFSGTCQALDLWNGVSLGTFTSDFGRDIAIHGAGLYRLRPLGN